MIQHLFQVKVLLKFSVLKFGIHMIKFVTFLRAFSKLLSPFNEPFHKFKTFMINFPKRELQIYSALVEVIEELHKVRVNLSRIFNHCTVVDT